MKLAVSHIPRIAGIILILAFLIEVMYDPISSVKHSLEVAQVRSEFPKALAKWSALEIKDYRFEIIGSAPSICEVSAIIQVKNDAVVKVETKDFSSQDSAVQILPPDQWANPDWGDEVFLCNYNHFTMTRIFDLLGRSLQNGPSTILKADFDPTFGFITDFSYGLYIGHGLLNPQINDWINSLSIKNFQVLD